jgi:hypothetical protein
LRHSARIAVLSSSLPCCQVLKFVLRWFDESLKHSTGIAVELVIVGKQTRYICLVLRVFMMTSFFQNVQRTEIMVLGLVVEQK